MEDVGPEKGGSAGDFQAARMRQAQGAELLGQAEHKEQGPRSIPLPHRDATLPPPQAG